MHPEVLFSCLLSLTLGFDPPDIVWQGQNLKRITGLAFSPDGAKVYGTSEGAAEVLEWDLKVRCR